MVITKNTSKQQTQRTIKKEKINLANKKKSKYQLKVNLLNETKDSISENRN